MNMLTRRPGSVFNLLDGIDFDIPQFNWVWADNNRPDVDIREEDDRFVLEAELPGVSEKDIDIQIDNSRLTIEVGSEEEKDTEKGKEKGKEKAKYLLRERRSTHLTRTFALSPSVDASKIEASFKNGVLQIIAPKKEQERSKSIEVKAA